MMIIIPKYSSKTLLSPLFCQAILLLVYTNSKANFVDSEIMFTFENQKL
jgi:hypothetical protein